MIILTIGTVIFLKDHYERSFIGFLILMVLPFLYMKCVTSVANKIYESDPLSSIH